MSKRVEATNGVIDSIYDGFISNICKKAKYITSDNCEYANNECLMGKCIIKYILKEYGVQEKK